MLFKYYCSPHSGEFQIEENHRVPVGEKFISLGFQIPKLSILCLFD